MEHNLTEKSGILCCIKCNRCFRGYKWIPEECTPTTESELA